MFPTPLNCKDRMCSLYAPKSLPCRLAHGPPFIHRKHHEGRNLICSFLTAVWLYRTLLSPKVNVQDVNVRISCNEHLERRYLKQISHFFKNKMKRCPGWLWDFILKNTILHSRIPVFSLSHIKRKVSIRAKEPPVRKDLAKCSQEYNNSLWGQSSTVGKALAMNIADPGSTPDITFGPQRHPRSNPWTQLSVAKKESKKINKN